MKTLKKETLKGDIKRRHENETLKGRHQKKELKVDIKNMH